jgi:16S rRNA (guanine966-N2)-methyltransferase
MRVIAGSQKGRRLRASEGLDIRPTSGRVKEALFSIIGGRIGGARFLDLYAGTGAIGIEALSRGAQRVAFVESNPASLRLLKTNLDHCRLSSAVDIYPCTTESFLERVKMSNATFDIVFADPPYRMDSACRLLPSLAQSAIIATQTTVILEHPTKQIMPPHIGRLRWLRQYRYGDTSLSTFQVTAKEVVAP